MVPRLGKMCLLVALLSTIIIVIHNQYPHKIIRGDLDHVCKDTENTPKIKKGGIQMAQTKYDREFKELVVQRIINGETTINEMARDLELHYTTVRDWVRQYKKDGQNAFPGKGYLT